MNLRFLNRPLEVSTPGAPTVDPDYGTEVPGPPTTATVNGYVEHASTNEQTIGQQTSPTRWWGLLPADTAVVPTSTVRIIDSDQTFEVVGEPSAEWNPRTRRTEFIHVELAEQT